MQCAVMTDDDKPRKLPMMSITVPPIVDRVTDGVLTESATICTSGITGNDRCLKHVSSGFRKSHQPSNDKLVPMIGSDGITATQLLSSASGHASPVSKTEQGQFTLGLLDTATNIRSGCVPGRVSDGG